VVGGDDVVESFTTRGSHYPIVLERASLDAANLWSVYLVDRQRYVPTTLGDAMSELLPEAMLPPLRSRHH
jgi:hypothetical protein